MAQALEGSSGEASGHLRGGGRGGVWGVRGVRGVRRVWGVWAARGGGTYVSAKQKTSERKSYWAPTAISGGIHRSDPWAGVRSVSNGRATDTWGWSRGGGKGGSEGQGVRGSRGSGGQEGQGVSEGGARACDETCRVSFGGRAGGRRGRAHWRSR